MRVAIFGPTGGTGRLLVERALGSGHEVHALARNPESLGISHERLEVVHGDVLEAPSVDPVVAGRETVLSALSSRSLKATTLYSRGTANVVRAR